MILDSIADSVKSLWLEARGYDMRFVISVVLAALPSWTALLTCMVAGPVLANDSKGLYALWTRAQMRVGQGAGSAALTELDAACSIERQELDRTEMLFTAECQRWVGEQRLAIGQLDAAFEDLGDAHALYSGALGALNPLSGEVLYLLARIHLESGDPVHARLAMDRALAILPPLDRSEAQLCREVHAASGFGSVPRSCQVVPASARTNSVAAVSGPVAGARFGMSSLPGNRRFRGFHLAGLPSGYGLEIGAEGKEFWRGRYESGSINGRAVWVTVPEEGTEQYYAGSWKGGKHHGYGTSLFKDWSRYTGEHNDGVAEGIGEFEWAAGLRYSGSFLASRFDGEGTLVVPGFLRFVGMWKNGKRNGKGVAEYADGLIEYRGEYVENRPSGWGRVFVDGHEVFSGDVDPEVGIGFGTKTVSGETYVGQLGDGKPVGLGLRRAADGAIATGVWAGSRRLRAWSERDLAVGLGGDGD